MGEGRGICPLVLWTPRVFTLLVMCPMGLNDSLDALLSDIVA